MKNVKPCLVLFLGLGLTLGAGIVFGYVFEYYRLSSVLQSGLLTLIGIFGWIITDYTAYKLKEKGSSK